MTKEQCLRSLLIGIVVIALAGSAAGAFAGQVFAGRAAAEMEQTETFSTLFSNGAVQLDRERKDAEEKNDDSGEETESASVYLTDTDWRMSVVCGGGVFLFTLAAALTGICGNLRREPMALLASAESGR